MLWMTLVGAVGFGPAVFAEDGNVSSLDWLYQVDQYVLDQGEEARLASAQRSLLTVLSRTSGLASVPRGAVITEALKNPARYYTQYVYFDPLAVTESQRQRIDRGEDQSSTDLALRFEFQPGAIKQLARDAKLPIWWSRRPLTMVWMVLDEPSGRAVVEHGTQVIRRELDAAANQRGLPTLLPMMDLQDSLLVNPSVVWGRFTDVLDQASRRYAASQYLLGRFSVQEILGERLYTGEWLIRSEVGESSQFVRGLDIENLVTLGIDMATQSVLDQHLVFTDTPRQQDLRVLGVASIGAYADVLDYLESLEFIDDVAVLGVQQQTLALSLATVASDEQLRALLQDDGLFEYQPGDLGVGASLLGSAQIGASGSETRFAAPSERMSDLEFVWRGSQ